MSKRRKFALIFILLIVIAHVALFVAGGTWRSAGLALIAVDVVSAWFVLGAVHEMCKLDRDH